MSKIWFRKMGKGWLYAPVAWQGWVATLAYLAVVILIFIGFNQNQQSASDTLIKFALPFILLSGAYIILCRKTSVAYENPLGNKFEESVGEKRQAYDKILKYLSDQGSITNNQTQNLLKVSDATATNYLYELETLGKIVQINERGRNVYYVLKK